MSLWLKQLFEPESSTYTYLVIDRDTREAIMIDPVAETSARDVKLIGELKLKLKYSLETHIHADHVTGAHRIKLASGCQTAVCGSAPTDAFDVKLVHGQTLVAGGINIQVIATPGHTDTCLSYYCAAGGWVFTGDTLLVRGCGRTDFQSGDAAQLFASVHERLYALPEQTMVYPAHDYNGFTSSTIGEEKLLNPRLTKSRADFIHLMQNLNLAKPKKIDAAVPGNLRAGAL